MSDKTLETKAVEILDASQSAIAGFADKLAEMAKQYGPDVANAALQMARVDAANALMPGFVTLVVLAASYIVLRVTGLLRVIIADVKDGGPCIVVAIPGGIAAAGAFFYALTTIMNLWAWVGIFEPKLWLAKRVLGL